MDEYGEELAWSTQELTYLCSEIEGIDLDQSEDIDDVLLRVQEMIEDDEAHLRELFGIVDSVTG